MDTPMLIHAIVHGLTQKSAILAYLQILMKQKSSHNQWVHILIKKNYELI